jgi:hypothetical protein
MGLRIQGHKENKDLEIAKVYRDLGYKRRYRFKVNLGS